MSIIQAVTILVLPFFLLLRKTKVLGVMFITVSLQFGIIYTFGMYENCSY